MLFKWCWRRLFRVPYTVRTLSILKKISPGCSLEWLMLKLEFQYFGHLKWRADSFEKTLMLGKLHAVPWQESIWSQEGRSGPPLGMQSLRQFWGSYSYQWCQAVWECVWNLECGKASLFAQHPSLCEGWAQRRGRCSQWSLFIPLKTLKTFKLGQYSRLVSTINTMWLLSLAIYSLNYVWLFWDPHRL